MDNWQKISPDFEQEIRLAMAVSEVEASYLSHLRSNLLHQSPAPQPTPWRRTFWRRPVLVATLLALSLALAGILLAGPQNVWAAVQRLVGFIPGIGFVDTTRPVLALAGPVEARQGDVTVRVESAVSDSKTTVINLQVEGVDAVPRGIGNVNDSQPTLRLPDGTLFSSKSITVGYEPPYPVKMVFEPLPNGTREAILSLTTIPGIPLGIGPQDWQISLPFEPQVEGSVVGHGSSLMLDSPSANGFALRLLNVSTFKDRTAIQVQIRSDDPGIFPTMFGTEMLSLKDAQGRLYPWEGELLSDMSGQDAYTLSTRPIQPGEKLTLTLNGPLQVTRRLAVSETVPAFSLDLGPNPELGQAWDLDEIVSVGDKTIHLTGAQLNQGDNGWAARLDFQAEATPDFLEARLTPVGFPGDQVSSNGNMFVYFKSIPQGPLTFELSGLGYLVDGTWTIEWVAP